MQLAKQIILFVALGLFLVLADWALTQFVNPGLANASWFAAIYALTIFDATIGFKNDYSLKAVFPGVRWFDCVVYSAPFLAMVAMGFAPSMGGWVLLLGIPLFFLFGLYFMARMPALRRGSAVSFFGEPSTKNEIER